MYKRQDVGRPHRLAVPGEDGILRIRLTEFPDQGARHAHQAFLLRRVPVSYTHLTFTKNAIIPANTVVGLQSVVTKSFREEFTPRVNI